MWINSTKRLLEQIILRNYRRAERIFFSPVAKLLQQQKNTSSNAQAPQQLAEQDNTRLLPSRPLTSLKTGGWTEEPIKREEPGRGDGRQVWVWRMEINGG
jgi:hypothetical protein